MPKNSKTALITLGMEKGISIIQQSFLLKTLLVFLFSELFNVYMLLIMQNSVIIKVPIIVSQWKWVEIRGYSELFWLLIKLGYTLQTIHWLHFRGSLWVWSRIYEIEERKITYSGKFWNLSGNVIYSFII